MSIKFFLEFPVLVRDEDGPRVPTRAAYSRTSAIDAASLPHTLSIRITMGPDATAADAVKEFSRKIESVLKTVDIGDEE